MFCICELCILYLFAVYLCAVYFCICVLCIFVFAEEWRVERKMSRWGWWWRLQSDGATRDPSTLHQQWISLHWEDFLYIWKNEVFFANLIQVSLYTTNFITFRSIKKGSIVMLQNICRFFFTGGDFRCKAYMGDGFEGWLVAMRAWRKALCVQGCNVLSLSTHEQNSLRRRRQ